MPVCPECYSRGMIKFGQYRERQKWHCMDCGFTTVYPRQRQPKRKISNESIDEKAKED